MLRWSGRRWLYLSLPVLALLPIYFVYVYTHPYPALAGGLYLMMAEMVGQHGYSLPARIPHYTAGGIPFGYPPLMFYVIAALTDLGVSGLDIARLFPIIPLVLSVGAYYVFSTELFGESKRKPVLAAAVIATSPAVLQRTLSAGGFVRATGLLFAVVGLFVALRAFRDDSWRYTAVSAVLFGLVVLTHPEYALFFGTSCLVFYLWFSRDVPGLLRGICVAVGGLLLASPWWLSVGTRHGFDVFLQASGTHEGIGTLLWIVSFMRVFDTFLPSLWPTLVAVAAVYLVVQREYFLPFWFATVGFVTGKDEHLMLVGALMSSVMVFDVIASSISSRWTTGDLDFDLDLPESTSTMAFVTLIVVYSVVSGIVFVEDGPIPSEDEFMSFIDSEDVEAMEWANRETPRDSSFVVVGDAAEWFPLYANRTSLVAVRGSEWVGQYQQTTELRSELSGCLSSSCLTGSMEDDGLDPDYVYVARDGYEQSNNRALMDARWAHLRPSLRNSSNYRLAFENDGVVVFEYTKRSS